MSKTAIEETLELFERDGFVCQLHVVVGPGVRMREKGNWDRVDRVMSSQRDQSLFSGTDWFTVEAQQKQSIESDIEAIDGNRLLNTSIDDLCEFLYDKFRIVVPELRKD